MPSHTASESQPQASFDWRTHLPIHTAADAYPKVPHERLIKIGEDIRKNGLQSPIIIHAKGDPANPDVFELFDGVTRLDAMAAVGIKFELERFCFKRGSSLQGYHSLRLVIHDIPTDPGAPNTTKVVHNLSDDEIATYIESANLHRRHLEPEQYHARIEASHARIEAAIKRNPEKSDRAIGKEVGHDHKTISGVRRKMEDVGNLPHVEKRTDSKGRKQPAKKSKPVNPKKTVAKPASSTAVADALITEVVLGDDTETSAELRKTEYAAADTLPTDTKAGVDKPAHKGVSAKDIALDEFDDHVLRLAQMIRGGRKPERFARTVVKGDDLATVGKFLIDLAELLKAAAS